MNDLNAATPVPGPTIMMGVVSDFGRTRDPFFSQTGIGSECSSI